MLFIKPEAHFTTRRRIGVAAVAFLRLFFSKTFAIRHPNFFPVVVVSLFLRAPFLFRFCLCGLGKKRFLTKCKSFKKILTASVLCSGSLVAVYSKTPFN
jgi:hypothetical protein